MNSKSKTHCWRARHIATATGAAFVFGVSALWAGPPKPGTDAAEKAVAMVRARVEATDKNEASYRKVERNLQGYSLEGGVLTGLFKGGEIVRMTARHFGESGKATEEYYLQNGSLIFMLRTDFSYESLRSDKIVRRDQTRYYWNPAGDLVRVIDKNKTLTPSQRKSGVKPTPSDYARDAQKDCATFAALLRAPDKNKTDKDPR